MKKILLLIVLCLGLTGCGGSDKTDTPDDAKDKPVEETDIYDREKDSDKITALELSYKEANLTGVFNVSDVVETFGFTFMDHVVGDEIVSGNTEADKSIYLYLDETTSTLVKAWNTFSEEKTLSECLVTRFAVAIQGFRVNGITIGEDTYETVIEKFGKPDSFRDDTIQDEITHNGYVQDVYYEGNFKADSETDELPSAGNHKLTSVRLNITFDSDGVVKDINIDISHEAIE